MSPDTRCLCRDSGHSERCAEPRSRSLGVFAWHNGLKVQTENCLHHAARQSAGGDAEPRSDILWGGRVSGVASLFSEEQIRARVDSVAHEIAQAPLKPDIALPVLAGSFVFAADLLRALAKLGLSLPMEFIWLRRYGADRHGSEVAVLLGPPAAVPGRTALLSGGV